MKKSILHINLCLIILLLKPDASFAQWYNNDSTYNAGGLVKDRMQQAINSANGFYSTHGSTGASNQNGVFEHYGQSGEGDSSAFINRGTYDASVNGIDYFYGPSGVNGQQAIAGTIAPLFGELYLNNGSASVFNITNLQGANVATAVYFNNGITTTIRNNAGAGALRFFYGANYAGITTTNVAGDSRYVDGYVTNIGNDSFTFPVGQSGIQAVTVDNMPVSSQIAVAYFRGDPGTTPDPSDGYNVHSRNSVAAPVSSVASTGFWDWIQSGDSSGSVIISVKIPDESGFGLAADLRLVGWNGTQWVNLGGSSGASGITRFNTLSGIIDLSAGITAIAVGAVVNVVLPVTLVNFDGAVDKECVTHLRWLSAYEQGLKYYSIEASSDGLNFAPVGRVTAKNNRAGSAYTFDYTNRQGLRFIRLRIQDIGNGYCYSPVISLLSNCGVSVISVLPNPATNRIQVKGLTGERNTIFIYSTAGAQVAKLVSHANTQVMDISRFPAGTYIVKVVKADGGAVNVKIEKH